MAFCPTVPCSRTSRTATSGCGTRRPGPPAQATRRAAPPTGTTHGSDFSRPDAEFSAYSWSPDGRYITLHFDDRRQVRTVLFPDYLTEETSVVPLRRDYTGDNQATRSLVLYSVRDGRLLDLDIPSPNERVLNMYARSPDGSRLLVDQSSMDARHRWILRSLPRTAESRCCGTKSAIVQLPGSGVDLGSDGNRILLVSDKDGRDHLYALGLDGGDLAPLTSGDWSVVGESGSAFGTGGAETGVLRRQPREPAPRSIACLKAAATSCR